MFDGNNKTSYCLTLSQYSGSVRRSHQDVSHQRPATLLNLILDAVLNPISRDGWSPLGYLALSW